MTENNMSASRTPVDVLALGRGYDMCSTLLFPSLRVDQTM